MGKEDCTIHLLDVPSTRTLAALLLPIGRAVNMPKVQKLFPDARAATASQPADNRDSFRILIDSHCTSLDTGSVQSLLQRSLGFTSPNVIWSTSLKPDIGDFHFTEAGDLCIQCHGRLLSGTSIEVGHTFFLGTKYSRSLDATFARLKDPTQKRQHYQMGCYGIGITRLLGSIAEVCSDERGLYWPSSIAPYRLCIISLDPEYPAAILPFLSKFIDEIVVDDRPDHSFGKKMADAEIIGYPCVLILGRKWKEGAEAELKDRRSGRSVFTHLDNIEQAVTSMLSSSAQPARSPEHSWQIG